MNAIVPTALTRTTPGIGPVEELVATEQGRREPDAANRSPLVVWLAGPSSAAITGRTFGTRQSDLDRAAPEPLDRACSS